MQSILLVDDHAMIRDAVKIYLYGHPAYRIEDEAENGKEAFDKMMNQSFDLVITDVHMPGSGGLELIENIRLNFPDQKILALTMEKGMDFIQKLYAFDIQGYMLKNVTKNELIITLDQIFSGKKVFSSDIKVKLNDIEEEERLKNTTMELGQIEIRLLKLIIKQTPHDEIARALGLEPLVFRLLLKSLYRKSNCTSEQGLVLYAVDKGLI